MSAPIIRLGSRHKRLAYTVFALLWASGALWLLLHYFFGVEGDFGPAPHPLEKWALRLHGLAAMLALVALGSLTIQHMRLAWSRHKNRRTGLAMLGLSAWMAATGYALYYFSSDANAAWLPLLHWVPGLALPVALAFHILVGRQRPARAQPRPRQKDAPTEAAAADHRVVALSSHASQKARP